MENLNFWRNWSILIALLLVVFLGVRAYWNNLQTPVNSQDIKLKAFVIQREESINSIAQRLEKAGLIKSAWAFRWILRSTNQASKIQAGDFKLSASMNTSEIIDTLSKGATDRWVTLIEGLRVEEMGKKLNNELGVDSEVFVQKAKRSEGYLFPDTYLINRDATIEDIIAILRNTFNKRYDEKLQLKIKALGLTPEQGVILASIVEREARSDQARTQIASILLKRLKIGMGLNADATVQYALGYQPDQKSWWKRNLTKDDLKIDSSYNSYLYRGLSPTPICNPGLSSLQAVANADPTTPYLYYYHDLKGNSYYAKTLEEHNQNVADHP